MTNSTTALMDFKTTQHWARAMNVPASVIMEHTNVLQFAVSHDTWFMPDMDEEGCVIDNDRLEQFRLACLYDCLSNMLDIGINLDDDATGSVAFYNRLTANDHDDRNAPSWLTHPEPYHITWRTHNYPHVHTH